MFNWGDRLYRWRWRIIATWALVLLGSLPAALAVSSVLKVGGFSSPNAESSRARALLEDRLGISPVSLVVVFQSDDWLATDPAYAAAMRQALEPVRRLPEVTTILYPDDHPNQLGSDGRTAYALVPLALDPEQSQRLVATVRASMRPTPLRTYLAGAPAFYADIEEVSARDLDRAELLALPFAGLALLFVFRTVVAAAVPLAVGGTTVAVVLALIYLIGLQTDLSVFVLNLASMLGLGLAIDYSLFMTARFREELRRRDVPTALQVTVRTAGKAVAYSGLTVLIGLAALLLFDSMFLRSVGVAGVVVILVAIAGSLTLLPAVLAVAGTRIDAWRVWPDPPADGDFWERLARFVMRRPWRVLLPTLALLLLFGRPFLHVRFSSPDSSMLPAHLESRRGYDLLRQNFGDGRLAPLLIAVQAESGSILAPAHVAAVHEYTQRLKQEPNVVRVESIVTLDPHYTLAQYQLLYQSPLVANGLPMAGGMAARDDTTVITVVTDLPPNAREARALVERIRSTPVGPGLRHLVDGGAAAIADVVNGLYGSAAVALGLVVVATYLALLVLFRSVVVPLKAVIMNSLSITASYGALVWIFQDGNLAGLLNFRPPGFVEASLPLLMFGTLFGLSMDYEVFLLSRVKEAYDRTGDNAASVATGLRQSGRIITSAALIVVVVSASFATAEIVVVKALGLGIAIAVFLDSTVVRALLVPSSMALLGHLNWYAPPWLLRRLPHAPHLDEG